MGEMGRVADGRDGESKRGRCTGWQMGEMGWGGWQMGEMGRVADGRDGEGEVKEVNMHGRPSLHNTILPVVP